MRGEIEEVETKSEQNVKGRMTWNFNINMSSLTLYMVLQWLEICNEKFCIKIFSQVFSYIW